MTTQNQTNLFKLNLVNEDAKFRFDRNSIMIFLVRNQFFVRSTLKNGWFNLYQDKVLWYYYLNLNIYQYRSFYVACLFRTIMSNRILNFFLNISWVFSGDFFFKRFRWTAATWYEKEAGAIDLIVLLKRCVKYFECRRLRRAAGETTSEKKNTPERKEI